MLVELAGSDRQVGELTRVVGQPQALVSYHLARLRSGGLVSSHKSSFDGRAVYYRAHLDRCAELLASVGAALHPGLSVVRPPYPPLPVTRDRRHLSVLFLCTGNGTRSQIAEALMRRATGGSVQVASAGSHPKPVHPNAVKVLSELGIDIADARSKSVDQFSAHHVDYVITLCDKVREVCPDFPGQKGAMHWSIEDPSRLPGTLRETLPAFRAVAADLESRIAYLISLIDTPTSKEHTRHGR